MSAEEKKYINSLLADVATRFGLKIRLTVNNAHQLIEENYKRIKEIEESINSKLLLIQKAA